MGYNEQDKFTSALIKINKLSRTVRNVIVISEYVVWNKCISLVVMITNQSWSESLNRHNTESNPITNDSIVSLKYLKV